MTCPRLPPKDPGRTQKQSVCMVPGQELVFGITWVIRDKGLHPWPVLPPACPVESGPLPSPESTGPPPSLTHLPPLVPEELSGVLDDLLVRQLGVGLLLAEGEGFPQRHPEGPHVAGRGELALFTSGQERK